MILEKKKTFNAFAARHPWVGDENIHPKSIARELWEGFVPFAPPYLVDGEFAIAQVRELLESHVPGIHFYVLNKSQATCEVLKAVGPDSLIR
jgi:hypothetical protein